MSRGPRAAQARRDWGADETGCSILHVDMDAFFASVELTRRPELVGRPVIVGGAERSVVLAATYEARAFGVHSAMPMALARRLCPQAVVIPPDHRAYQDASRAVMEIVHEITALVEQISIDEAFLDVSGARRRLGPPTLIARDLRARVRAEVGITCSVGIATTKFVAKLASTHSKPDGLLLIPADATVPFLRTLPVGALWGVGERTEKTLKGWGITTVAELADTQVPTLQAAVGKAAGAHLHDLAWGRDPRPVEPGRAERSIGAETTFAHDLYDPAIIGSALLGLADRCATRLRSQGFVARTVSVKVRTSDFRTLTRSRTLASATDVAQEIHAVALELVRGVDRRGLPVRLVGVRAENLERRGAAVEQPTLEESIEDSSAAQREAERTLDRIRDRFGVNSIGPASTRRRSTTPGADVELS